MTVTQALVKLRDDIIQWCTLNFKNKADVTTTNELQATLTGVSTTASNAATQLQNHIDARNTHFSGDYEDLTNKPDISEDESGELIICDGNGNLIMKIAADGLTTTQLQLKDKVVLTSGKMYGTTTPTNPVEGQLFFLKIQE